MKPKAIISKEVTTQIVRKYKLEESNQKIWDLRTV